jgi:hypothetical protein
VSGSPLIAHVIHRLGIGGLENGLVNLLNHLPDDGCRHAVVCLTGATDFANRIRRDGVAVYELGKREGKDLRIYHALWRLFRQIRPAVVHSRNLAALDAQVPAALYAAVHPLLGAHVEGPGTVVADTRRRAGGAHPSAL